MWKLNSIDKIRHHDCIQCDHTEEAIWNKADTDKGELFGCKFE